MKQYQHLKKQSPTACSTTLLNLHHNPTGTPSSTQWQTGLPSAVTPDSENQNGVPTITTPSTPSIIPIGAITQRRYPSLPVTSASPPNPDNRYRTWCLCSTETSCSPPFASASRRTMTMAKLSHTTNDQTLTGCAPPKRA